MDQELAGALAAHYLAAYRNATEGPEADALAGAGPDRAARGRRPGGDARRAGAGARASTATRWRSPPSRSSGRPCWSAPAGPRRPRAPTMRPSGCSPRRSSSCAPPATGAARRASRGCSATRCSGGTASMPPSRCSSRPRPSSPTSATTRGWRRCSASWPASRCSARSTSGRRSPTPTGPSRSPSASIASDLVADTLVTRGVALVSIGRAYEGIGCLETGLRLAQQHGLLATEIRARTNMGGPLDRPRPARRPSRSRGSASSRPGGSGTGRASRCSSATRASGRSRRANGRGPAPRSPRGSTRPRAKRSGSSCWPSSSSCSSRPVRTPTAELDEVDAWLAGARRRRAVPRVEHRQQPGHPRDPGAATWRRPRTATWRLGRLDPYNAGRVVLRGDLPGAPGPRPRPRGRGPRARSTGSGSHAAMALLTTRVAEAGIAALDGAGRSAARAGLLAAYADFRDLGAARKQALTGLVMATLLGRGRSRGPRRHRREPAAVRADGRRPSGSPRLDAA